MWWLVIAFICGGIAGTIASTKGRSQFGWFFLAFLIGPFALLVAVLPPIANGRTTKKCPQCSEIIKYGAKVCKYCGSHLENSTPKPNTNKTTACPTCGNTDLRYTILGGGKDGWECPVCKR
jgi:RNA polymerase subunit RPABC4/transcription elongation factor Spt4